MSTIYVNRGPSVYVLWHLMMWLGRMLITEFSYVGCWLSFCALPLEFLGYALQSWFDLLEDSFSSFWWDAGSWVGMVALQAFGAATALA